MEQAAEDTARLRSADIVKLLSPRPLWRLVRGSLRAPFDERFAGLPLAVCWFTNFTCNARCPFCCKADEIGAERDAFAPLVPGRFEELLLRIRRSVDLLYLSGGEPLIHPHILDILREARRLEFASLGMSSNLIALRQHPEVLDFLDVLAVSIHSPDVDEHARNLGVSASLAGRVFENLDWLRSHPRRPKIRVLVNCVINELNIEAIPAMVEFTARNGFLLEVVPANDHGRVAKGLVGNPAYIRLIDTLLELRRSGRAPHLAGSTHYLERIRSFEPFRCFPYGVPNIMPDGRLCTPCDVSGQYEVNVLDFPDLKSAVKASRPHLGVFPCGQGTCFKAGIVERSRLFGLLSGN